LLPPTEKKKKKKKKKKNAYDVPDGNHPLTPMTKSPLAAARHAATQ
jgi:hypothetical protein